MIGMLGKSWIRFALVLLLFALAFLPLWQAGAYVSPGAPQGFVNDFAGLLSPETRQALEAKLSTFAQETGNEVAIATVPNLGEDTIENFAVELFSEWGVGGKERDTGVLLLVAAEEREVRIEVGYGLEGALTDAQSHGIIQSIIIPSFRGGNFDDGVMWATDGILAALEGETFAYEPVPERRGMSSDIWFFLLFILPMWLVSILGRSKSWWFGGVLGGIGGLIVGLFMGFLWIGVVAIGLFIPLGLLFDYAASRSYARARASGHYPWWIGGRGRGGHGGFGGFGGGMSGGGGASGRW